MEEIAGEWKENCEKFKKILMRSEQLEHANKNKKVQEDAEGRERRKNTGRMVVVRGGGALGGSRLPRAKQYSFPP